jgi:NAD(P)H-nitrite reductase large subunit
MASLVHQHLMDKGVNLYLEQAVASFERTGKELKVIFKNGQSIQADIVILSIGVRPETTLARAAGLTIGEAGICGWIRTTKDRKREHDWERADRKEDNNSEMEEMNDES